MWRVGVGGGGGGVMVCAGVVGTAIRHECCAGKQYQRILYKWSIAILPRLKFKKSKETCVFDDETVTTTQIVTSQLVCDVTINRPRSTSTTAKVGFCPQNSSAMQFTSDDMPLNEIFYENMYKWCHESRRNYAFINLRATKISKRCVFVLITWPWRLPEEWHDASGNLTMIGAGTMHGFGTGPIRNPTIWLVESRN